MGTMRGFLDFTRREFDYADAADRLRHFDEFIIPPDALDIKKQAARSMACDTPYCHALGCPLAKRIPEWNDFVFQNDIRKAYASLVRTNPFPEITGRVCPALCECACALAIDLAPVSIRMLELYIAEQAFAEGIVRPEKPARRRDTAVAVIGSGPAGLSAAWTLNALGYRVTVHERDEAIGGLLRFGIPNFKLPKRVLDRRIALMEQCGIRFETGVRIGEDVDLTTLRRQADAVVLCLGAGSPRDLPVPNRELDGIHFALPYLAGANRAVSGRLSADGIIQAKCKAVLVNGGDDTGSDCIGTAHRKSARRFGKTEIKPHPTE